MCSNTSTLHLAPDSASSTSPGKLAAGRDRGCDTFAGMTEHPSITRFREAWSSRGGQGRIVVLPDSVHTAALAAEALGCEVGAIANSLLFAGSTEDGDRIPVLILTSGAHRVDTAKAAALVGTRELRRAKPDFVLAATGQVIGGVAPVGHPAPIRTLVDQDLAGYPQVWAAGGIPHAVFPTTLAELVRLTGGTVAEVA